MWKKGDLSDFKCGIVISLSQTAHLLGFSCKTNPRVYREWSNEGQLSGLQCLLDARGK